MRSRWKSIAALSIAAWMLPLSAHAADKIKISVPADNATFAPIFIADQKGYFKDEGLEVEILNAGGGVSTPALIAGDLQFSGSPASALSAIMKGGDLRVVISSSNHPQYWLWSLNDSVKSFDDLKGKTLAIVTRGDSMEIATRLYLKQKNLSADYVGFTPLGPDAGRLAAIASGAQPYAVLMRVDIAQLRQMGALKGREVVNSTARWRC